MSFFKKAAKKAIGDAKELILKRFAKKIKKEPSSTDGNTTPENTNDSTPQAKKLPGLLFKKKKSIFEALKPMKKQQTVESNGGGANVDSSQGSVFLG